GLTSPPPTYQPLLLPSSSGVDLQSLRPALRPPAHTPSDDNRLGLHFFVKSGGGNAPPETFRPLEGQRIVSEPPSQAIIHTYIFSQLSLRYGNYHGSSRAPLGHYSHG